jgi:uncharacterized membrane protein
MDWTMFWGIVFRWLHIAAAATAVGAVFFVRAVVPGTLGQLDEPSARKAMLKIRRGLKRIVHVSIALLLISGTFNFVSGRHKYAAPGVAPVGQMLIGTHILLALMGFTLALLILSGPQPARWARKAMTINLVLLFVTIAAASSVKWFCEHHPLPARSTVRGQ